MIQWFKIELTRRERRILKTTVEDYIESVTPVASNFLKTQHRLSFSPATIRNTLSALEKKGLLTHTHTSSGRIPTDLGYRFYVDELMDSPDSPPPEITEVQRRLIDMSDNVDELMQAVAGMLAQISRMFALVTIGKYRESILKDIELVQLSSDRVMLVLATKSGLIRSISLNLKVAVDDSLLEGVVAILKERLLGLSLKEIQDTISERLRESHIYNHEIIQILINDPVHHFTMANNSIIYQSALTPLLDQPEFQDVEILQKTIAALDSKQTIDNMIDQIGDQPNFMVIGSENLTADLTHCSLVSSQFNLPDLTGQLVVLGPTRLPYQNILTILDKFTEILPDVC